MRHALVSLALVGCGTVAPVDDNPEVDAGELSVDAATVEIDADLPAPNIVFITSATSSADVGGLAGADSLCEAEANQAGLPGSYVAWLSTSSVDARDRLTGASGWVRPDGLPVAATIEDLARGRLLYPIDIEAAGNRAPGLNVWTGTGVDGRAAGGDCGGWEASVGTTTTGFVGSGPVDWTANTSSIGCGRDALLYCFGIDRAGAIEPPAIDGRTMFVSTTTHLGSDGVATFDATCASEATAAGLSGTYLAVVGRPFQAPSERLGPGEPWFRPDGVQIAATVADFELTNTIAPIAVTASGAYITGQVWTGAMDFGSTNTIHCNEWTDPAAGATLGIAERSGTFASVGATDVCSVQHAVYCGER